MITIQNTLALSHVLGWTVYLNFYFSLKKYWFYSFIFHSYKSNTKFTPDFSPIIK